MNRTMPNSRDWSKLPCSAESTTSAEFSSFDALQKKHIKKDRFNMNRSLINKWRELNIRGFAVSNSGSFFHRFT